MHACTRAAEIALVLRDRERYFRHGVLPCLIRKIIESRLTRFTLRAGIYARSYNIIMAEMVVVIKLIYGASGFQCQIRSGKKKVYVESVHSVLEDNYIYYPDLTYISDGRKKNV